MDIQVIKEDEEKIAIGSLAPGTCYVAIELPGIVFMVAEYYRGLRGIPTRVVVNLTTGCVFDLSASLSASFADVVQPVDIIYMEKV